MDHSNFDYELGRNTLNEIPQLDPSREKEFENTIINKLKNEDLKRDAIELRQVIDRFDLDIKRAKDLVLDIAGKLDESGACHRDEICRYIKNLLADKIKDGKITPRWIEEVLPKEYKHQYTKSELSSQSQKKLAPNVIHDNGLALIDNPNEADVYLSADKDETNQSFNKINTKLEQAQINLIVNKEQKNLIDKALDNCRQFCSLTFNESGVLVAVATDTSME